MKPALSLVRARQMNSPAVIKLSQWDISMTDTQTSQGPVDQQGRGADSGDLTLMQVTGSVLAAGFGVQSKENKLRDFSRGKPLQFIAAGLIFTLGLLAALVAVVSLVV